MILRVQHVLLLGHPLDAVLQYLLRFAFVFGRQSAGVRRIVVLETKVLTLGNAVRTDELLYAVEIGLFHACPGPLPDVIQAHCRARMTAIRLPTSRSNP
jgi:hypothetical protein